LRTSQATNLIAYNLVVSRQAGKRKIRIANRFHSIPKTMSYNSQESPVACKQWSDVQYQKILTK
jgi:hypothetical protein